MRSARVALTPIQAKSGAPTYATTSDGSGHFLLKNVPPGRYDFLAVAPGFVAQHYRSQGMNNEGAVLSLRTAQKVDDALFRMTRAAVITGRVINEDGEPMVRTQVVVLRRPTEDEIEDEGWRANHKERPEPVTGGHTDDRGQYRIFGLEPGEYYLKVTDQIDPDQLGYSMGPEFWLQQNLGTEYAPVYYPGVSQLGQAELISLRPGDEFQADLSMRRIRTVVVAGRVIGPAGPAKDASVSLDVADDEGYDWSHHDSTDDKGTFKLKGVPAGSYVLTVRQAMEEPYRYEATARQKLEVGDENIHDLTVILGLGAKFEGRIIVAGTGTPTLTRIRVDLNRVGDDDSNWYAGVKKDGTFEINSVSDGSYQLNVWGLEHGWYVKSARLGTTDLLENGLQVEKGASAGQLEVVVSSNCALLEGAVTEEDQPLIGARVHITPDPETPYNRSRSESTTTDQAGHFAMTCLPPGNYRAVARSTQSLGTESIKSEPQSLTLSERSRKTIDFKIAKPETQLGSESINP